MARAAARACIRSRRTVSPPRPTLRASLQQRPTARRTDRQQTAESLSTADQPDAAKKHIQQLIRQLGDPRYAARRAAASELRQIGAEAFDQLHEATGDSDPEVAASARYLLRRISVRWVQSDDSPDVRNLLARLRPAARQRPPAPRRRPGPNWPTAKASPACAASPASTARRIVSRMAALAIIRPGRANRVAIAHRSGSGRARTGRQLARRGRLAAPLPGPTPRPGRFGRLLAKTHRRRSRAARTETPPTRRPRSSAGLLWNLAEVHRQTRNRAAMFDVVDRMMGVDPDAVESTSVELLTWIIEHKSWEVLDEFLAKHQDQLEQSKRPLYYAAIARAKQGKAEQAEQLAEKAAQIDSQTTLESFFAAKDLEEHNQFDWAVREYRRSIDDEKIAHARRNPGPRIPGQPAARLRAAPGGGRRD